MSWKTQTHRQVKQFGRCVKYWRLQAGLTQLELGLALGWKDGSAITKIEKGTYNTTLESIYALSEVLGIAPGALFVESLDHEPVDLHGLAPPLQELLKLLITRLKQLYVPQRPAAEML